METRQMSPASWQAAGNQGWALRGRSRLLHRLIDRAERRAQRSAYQREPTDTNGGDQRGNHPVFQGGDTPLVSIERQQLRFEFHGRPLLLVLACIASGLGKEVGSGPDVDDASNGKSVSICFHLRFPYTS
jgi:hypothetical protein